MTRELVKSMKCKHCGSDDLVFSDCDMGVLEHFAPQVWTWECRDCGKTSCTIECGEV